jgi:hypothetical protein
MSSHTVNDVRWQCRCGRFVSEKSIEERTYSDPLSFYGVGVETRFTCPRCGRVDGSPRCVTVRAYTIEVSDE